jgi:DNA-binding NarL/FixJ family response regulator
MVSSTLGMAQSGAVKKFVHSNSASSVEPFNISDKADFLSAEAAIALNLIMDGYLLLNADGDIVLSNSTANQLLQKMSAITTNSHDTDTTHLPPLVWQACQSLLKNGEYLADHAIRPQATFTVAPDIEVRISLLPAQSAQPCSFLIALADKSQTSIAQATVDQWLYGLTNREKEVWALRLRDYSYQAIADELYLSVNTVKKHMKIILAKQEQWHFEQTELLAS